MWQQTRMIEKIFQGESPNPKNMKTDTLLFLIIIIQIATLMIFSYLVGKTSSSKNPPKKLRQPMMGIFDIFKMRALSNQFGCVS
jgi:hypothetical protein